MYHFISAEKDSTLYNEEPRQNTGLDPILEVGAGISATDLKRSILYFDMDDFPQNATDYSASLLMKQTESQELKLDYDVVVHPVSSSWSMGVGRREYEYSTQGVSWEYRNGESGLRWDNLGGDFDPLTFSSQSFSYESADLEVDVSNIIDEIVSGNIVNDGLIVKFPTDDENDSIDYGTLKFFSTETHTIFKPQLRIGWDNQVFTTGSLTSLETFENIKVQPILKPSYKVDTIQRVRVKGREKYPPKTFDEFQYNTDFFLPENTYYRVTDIVSKHEIIPFSDFSKVSCDSKGNFFELDFSNWEVDRVYEVEIKTIRNNLEEVYKDKFIFTLVR